MTLSPFLGRTLAVVLLLGTIGGTWSLFVEPVSAVEAHWFRLAEEQGHAGAQSDLAASYRNGWGVSKDYVKAVNWYRKAAEQGK